MSLIKGAIVVLPTVLMVSCVDRRDCSFACAGDNKRECGGAYRLSIYGPVPRSPAVALANAVQSCEPYCKTGWRGRVRRTRLLGTVWFI